MFKKFIITICMIVLAFSLVGCHASEYQAFIQSIPTNVHVLTDGTTYFFYTTFYSADGTVTTGFAWYSAVTKMANAGCTSLGGASNTASRLLMMGYRSIPWAEVPANIAANLNVMPIFIPMFMMNFVTDPYQLLGYQEIPA